MVESVVPFLSKSQAHEVIGQPIAIEVSVKTTVSGRLPLVGAAWKFAIGAWHGLAVGVGVGPTGVGVGVGVGPLGVAVGLGVGVGDGVAFGFGVGMPATVPERIGKTASALMSMPPPKRPLASGVMRSNRHSSVRVA